MYSAKNDLGKDKGYRTLLCKKPSIHHGKILQGRSINVIIKKKEKMIQKQLVKNQLPVPANAEL